jgi:transposase
MFFRLKKSGPRQYLQIVHNYWDKAKGKPRQQVLATLGRFDQIEESGSLESLLASGERFCQELMVLSEHKKDQTNRISTRRIGPGLIFNRLWKETGIEETLSDLLSDRYFEFNVEMAIFITVLHRILESGSDRSCNKWRRDYQIDGNEKLHLHHFYRAMFWLGENLRLSKDQDGIIPFIPRCTKDLIEEKLFERRRDLFSNLAVVFFDTTSIYFEGEGGEALGQYGNSKDHRPDRKQLVVGVILDDKGHPLCCEIWPGNTSDVKSLVPIVKRLKKRFRIGQVCIVSDRGMISDEVIEWLESESWPYILGVRMRQQKEVKEQVLSRAGRYRLIKINEAELKISGQGKSRDIDIERKGNGNGDKKKGRKAKPPLRVKEVEIEGRRYIVCFNVVQAQKEKKDRVEILKGLSAQLKRGGEKSLIGNKGYRKYVKIVGVGVGVGEGEGEGEVKGKSKGFEIDLEKVKSEARYDGKWVLRTNTNYDAAEVALKYKELWMVEQIFRSLKSLLETRPIYHRVDETITGHVFCSFLALVLIKELQERMNIKGYDFEWYDVLRDIGVLEEVEIEKEGKRFVLRSEAQGCCGEVFKAAGVGLPPSFRHVKSIENEKDEI